MLRVCVEVEAWESRFLERGMKTDFDFELDWLESFSRGGAWKFTLGHATIDHCLSTEWNLQCLVSISF